MTVQAHKITPFLWFDTQAEEAAQFYTSVFPNSRVTGITRYSEAIPENLGTAGAVMTVNFELEGMPFVALNGGPVFHFTEAISFYVHCADQAEVDYYWDRLLADGGEPSQCGWLKDRFGLSWQIVPEELTRLIGDPDPGRSQRAVQAMLQMSKIDVAAMRRAADGG